MKTTIRAQRANFPLRLRLLVLLLCLHSSHGFQHARLSRQRRAPPTFLGLTVAEYDDFVIRDSTYQELNQATDIIMQSFYQNVTAPWSQLYRVGELNRLQQGHTYNEIDRHRQLVAVTHDKDIIGFCDVDGREPNRATGYTFNPRPYLSDLCIHPDWRRRGVASKLVSACEDTCLQLMGKDELFIRVENRNVAAVKMYERLEYAQIDNPDDEQCDGKIVVLHKRLLVGSEFTSRG